MLSYLKQKEAGMTLDNPYKGKVAKVWELTLEELIKFWLLKLEQNLDVSSNQQFVEECILTLPKMIRNQDYDYLAKMFSFPFMLFDNELFLALRCPTVQTDPKKLLEYFFACANRNKKRIGFFFSDKDYGEFQIKEKKGLTFSFDLDFSFERKKGGILYVLSLTDNSTFCQHQGRNQAIIVKKVKLPMI